MAGKVVRAVGGRRDSYRPLACGLCGDAEPATVLSALQRLHPFQVLYVADLDAIEGTGDHADILARLRDLWPGELWLDAGPCPQVAGVRPVIGSETLITVESLRERLAWYRGAVLSLDFRGGRLLGPAALLQAPQVWPERVIVMSLDRVGSAAGPDLAMLRRLRRLAPDRRFWLAGGVRHASDVARAGSAGAAGVILSGALWDQRLGAAELRPYA